MSETTTCSTRFDTTGEPSRLATRRPLESRAERAAALEVWAERVQPEELRVTVTEALRVIAELAVQRERVDSELTAAVRAARAAHRSWSEIGTMLGVSKQAAQRKYGRRISA